MKKGDLVKRVNITENYIIDNFSVGDSGIVVRGPYEKNITDIFYSNNLKNLKSFPKIVEIKKVIDILCEDKVYKYRIASDYERIRT